MDNIEFDEIGFEIINSLTSVNNSVLFEKNNGRVEVKSASVDKSIAYIFSAPETTFDFKEDSIAFYDYRSFYSLIKLFDNAVLSGDDTNIFIKSGKRKATFRLSDKDLVKKTFNGINTAGVDAELRLDVETLKKIRSIATHPSVNADRIKMDIVDGDLLYTVYNTKYTANKIEDTLPINNLSKERFSVNLSVVDFIKIPLANYTVNFYEAGVVNFSMDRDDEITVQVYIAEMED